MQPFLFYALLVFLPVVISHTETTEGKQSIESPYHDYYNEMYKKRQEESGGDNKDDVGGNTLYKVVNELTHPPCTSDNVEKTVISSIVEDAGKSYLDVIINADVYIVKVLIYETISTSLLETIGRVLVKYELSRLYDYTPEVRCLLLVHKKGMENDVDLFTLYSGDEQLLIINGRKSVVGEAISAILSYRATKK